jgi:hypothetical protein
VIGEKGIDVGRPLAMPEEEFRLKSDVLKQLLRCRIFVGHLPLFVLLNEGIRQCADVAGDILYADDKDNGIDIAEFTVNITLSRANSSEG